MKHQRFSLFNRLKSFKFAGNGLRILIIEEHNARIHVIAAIGVIAAGIIFKISMSEWIAVVFSIAVVFVTEIINSSIENLADFVSPAKHEKIKKIKDLSAAGVLLGAIAATIVGLIVFIPRILSLF
ncbi:MAG TPA: diacylglycerol kinase family protein [Bacteroidales bacterium]|nr:diacylglycerol kinase family protein [Bacteroidales bacterium]HOE05793.1 diacylglycerol kinase family protein [Bacteroidales bacterium]